MRLAVEIAGWSGAVLILIGYMLLTAGKVDARTPLYQWMNVLGAAGFIANGAYHGAMPSAILNIIWMGIGLFALWRIFKSRQAPASPE